MNHAYRLHDEAERDLYEAAAHIAWDNPDAAERLLDAFAETCELLAGMPEAGSLLRTTHEKLRDIRMFRVTHFTKFLIFYRPLQQQGITIEVVRVIHAARDYPTFFDE
jgi:plasmid stabilization system protein ParE